MRVAVIVNPAARKGEAVARWPAIQAELAKRLGPVEPLFTQAPGHATDLARTALAQGVRRFVAVGGDGTANETLNGLLDPSGRLVAPNAVLCPVPAGTANELCRALGHLADAGRAFDAAASPRSQAIDLMRVRCEGLDGRPVDRFGYLIVALGLAATISHRTSQSRWLKKLGEIAYLLMTPGVTLTYRQREVSIEIDGVPAGTRRLFTAMIGNTENGGGGTAFRFGSAGVETLVDLDGEMVGRLPLEVTVLPQAFRVGTV
jgi:diacylglycerol kinase (ATP)